MKIYLLKKENNDTTVRRGRGICLNYIQQYAYLDYITFVKNISVKKENNGTKVRRGEAPSEQTYLVSIYLLNVYLIKQYLAIYMLRLYIMC